MISWLWDIIVGRCFHKWGKYEFTCAGLYQKRICKKCNKRKDSWS